MRFNDKGKMPKASRQNTVVGAIVIIAIGCMLCVIAYVDQTYHLSALFN